MNSRRSSRFVFMVLGACTALALLVILVNILNWQWWLMVLAGSGLFLAFLFFVIFLSAYVQRSERGNLLVGRPWRSGERLLVLRNTPITPAAPIAPRRRVESVLIASNEETEHILQGGITFPRLRIGRPRLRVPRPRIRVTSGAASALGITELAAWLAGSRRPEKREEWRSHLRGESGSEPLTWRKVPEALKFVEAAIKLRLQDVAEIAWIPVDAILKSRTLSNMVVFVSTLAVAQAVFHRDSFYGLIAQAENILAVGGAVYGAIRTGRWWRGVKPPKPKPRRVRK